MTEKQPDPWATVEWRTNPLSGEQWGYRKDVDAARAEDARRHAEEIETLKAEHAEFRDSVASALVVENPDGPVSDEAIVMAAYESTMQLLDPPFSPSTQLAGMATERDALRAQLAAVQEKAEQCVWRRDMSGAWTNPCAGASTPLAFHQRVSNMWKHCPYCGKPLTLKETKA